MNNFNFVLVDASLVNYNTYKIKTKTKYLAKPNNIKELQSLLTYLNNHHLKYYVLGKGSNVILPDTEFNGCIISLEKMQDINIKDGEVTVLSGALLGDVIKKVIANNLGGLEYLYGIPGTIGGALYGNAGAYNHTIYDNIKDITVLRDNNIITLNKEDVKIDYRYSSFKDNHDIILGCTFNLQEEDKTKMQEVIKEILKKRQNNLPLEYPNAGSVFKNPPGDAAGRIIDSLNLKGYTIGDAQISLKHANFIVNIGNMTSKDLKELIAFIQEKVYNELNIKLDLEQIIIDWD